MDPGDAADELAHLDAAPADQPPPQPDHRDQAATHRATGTTITSVKVDGNFRSIEVIGDDDVREAVAEGPHRVRREGDVLVIDGAAVFDDDDDNDDDREDFGDWFRTTGPRRLHRARMTYTREYRPRPLRVRVNPDLAVDARVEAGPLTIRRVRGPLKARVAAGPLIIEGFQSPIDVRVAAGKVVARGRADHGVSTIDCDAGKVTLHLEHGSSARVNATATLGKVDFGGKRARHDRSDFDWGGVRDDFGNLSDLGDKLTRLFNNTFSEEHEAVVGAGAAVFDIRVSMGSADITFDDDAPR
ncbi:MAG: hypothetical protein QOJ00_677 [Actinomycetota bacterium]